MTDSLKTSDKPMRGSWSARIDTRLASALKAANASLEAIDPFAVRMSAVPLPKHFNKMRTNLLVQQDAGLIRIYVDDDLTYEGTNPAMTALLSGPSDRKWRQMALNIPVGEVGQVVRAALEALGSPIVAMLHVDAQHEFDAAHPDADRFDPHSVLATETRPMGADQMAASFKSSNHKLLATPIGGRDDV